MTRHSSDDELLRSYFRGELPEPEEDALERRLLVEDELFDLLEALEAELLAETTRGDTPSTERDWVLQRLASSPRGRERLALARSLNALADELPEVRAPRAPVVPRRHRISRSRLGWSTLAAAAVLLLAVGLPHPRIRGFEITRQFPICPPTPPGNPEPPIIPPIGTEPPTIAHSEPPEPVKAVFTLSLATLRGTEEEEEVLEVPAETDVIELKLDLEGLDGFESYRAIIKNADHLPVWEQSGLTSRQVSWDAETRGPALVLQIPAEKLPFGRRYEVVVAAGTETLAQVFFEVERKK